jgi:putative hydrolase of HD superfamily
MFQLTPRLSQQIDFITEVDKLKQILRQNSIIGGSRRENTAEHSWYISLIALTFVEYAPQPIDLTHTLKMLILHDIVEIDAGDTFTFDVQANQSKAERETLAAERIFGLLPEDQRDSYRALWDEFEEGQTNEAKYANALDRFAPLIQNFQNQGGTWRKYQITQAAVLKRMQPIQTATPDLWPFVLQTIEQSIQAGYIVPSN